MNEIVILILSVLGSSMSINIDCKFNTDTYFYTLSKVYTCVVQSVSNPDDEVVTITGTHASGKTNDDVIGIFGGLGNIEIFPKNLGKIFKNLKAIYTTSSGQIKEIHKDDLKNLPNLVELLLDHNKIEVVEEGLFDYNPNLEAISFYYNKVYHVNSNVFDNLHKLRFLWMNGSPCYSSSSHDRINTLKLISEVQKSCQNPEIVKFEVKLKTLKAKSKDSNQTEEFKVLLRDNENYFMNIQDPRMFYLKQEFLRLKELNSMSTTTQAPVTSTTPKQECPEQHGISKTEFLVLGEKFDNLNSNIEVISNNCINNLNSNKDTCILDEKLQYFEENLNDFRNNVLKKFEVLENEYKLTHYKMAVTLDNKLKRIEERLLAFKEDLGSN